MLQLVELGCYLGVCEHALSERLLAALFDQRFANPVEDMERRAAFLRLAFAGFHKPVENALLYRKQFPRRHPLASHDLE